MTRQYLGRAVLLVFVAFAMVAPVAHAADAPNLPLFNPNFRIVPDAHLIDPVCPSEAPLGFGGFLQLIQNLMNAAVSAGILFMILAIVYAGVLLLLSPTNPENRSTARKMVGNAFVGLMVVLSSWLVIDFLMKIIYNGTTDAHAQFGPWNGILHGGFACIFATQTTPIQGLPGVISDSITGTDVTATPVSSGPPQVGSGNCSPTSMVSYGIDPTIAGTMSCIAQHESTCRPAAQNSTTSAHGLFQITFTGNSAGHNRNFPSCTAAAVRAGFSVTGNLNCSRGWHNGDPKSDMMTLVNACKAADSDPTCNSQSAMDVYRTEGFKAWKVYNDGKCG
jgi:hypothetical protein